MSNLLITGLPRCGKTTLIRRVLRDPSVLNRAGGFITEEFMKENKRAGFMIITIPSGKTALLAKKNLPSPHRVGSYGISLKDLEDTGCRAIQKALDSARFIVVDEIGKMELFSKEFQRLIIEAMESPVKFLATIMERSNAFADWVKSRGDVQLIHLTRENSEQVFVKVQNWMVE